MSIIYFDKHDVSEPKIWRPISAYPFHFLFSFYTQWMQLATGGTCLSGPHAPNVYIVQIILKYPIWSFNILMRIWIRCPRKLKSAKTTQNGIIDETCHFSKFLFYKCLVITFIWIVWVVCTFWLSLLEVWRFDIRGYFYDAKHIKNTYANSLTTYTR